MPDEKTRPSRRSLIGIAAVTLPAGPALAMATAAPAAADPSDDADVAALIEDELSATSASLRARFVRPRATNLDPAQSVAPLPFVNVVDFGAKGVYSTGGYDDTAAFQAAIDHVHENGGGEVMVPPGRFRISQIVLREGVTLRGTMPTLGGTGHAIFASKLIQKEGSSVPLVIGESFIDPGGGKYLLACGMRDLGFYGIPTQNPNGTHAFAAMDEDGNLLNWQHGCFLDNLFFTGFRGDCVRIAGGSGVQHISHIFGYMNGGYVINIGGADGNVQHVHLIDISGDGNGGGAVVRIAGQTADYQTSITGLKSEQVVNLLLSDRQQPTVPSQPNALHLHNCASDVVVTGLQHIAGLVWSITGGTLSTDPSQFGDIQGGTPTKPGSAIKITNDNTGVRPLVMYQGKKVRSLATQTGGDTPAWIEDHSNGNTRLVPNDHIQGAYGGDGAATMTIREQTPGKFRKITGVDGTPPVLSATSSEHVVMSSSLAASFHAYVRDAAANQKSIGLRNHGDGRSGLRIHKDDGSSAYDAITFRTDTNGVPSEWGIRGLTAPYKAFTQSYSTADATLGAYTPNIENTAYSGSPSSPAGTARLADLNALRAAYENLRAFTEDLAQFTNSVVDALQAHGIFKP